jgi:hypothetical protein
MTMVGKGRVRNLESQSGLQITIHSPSLARLELELRGVHALQIFSYPVLLKPIFAFLSNMPLFPFLPKIHKIHKIQHRQQTGVIASTNALLIRKTAQSEPPIIHEPR